MNAVDRVLHILLSCLYPLFLFERGFFQLRAMLISGEADKFKGSIRKIGALVLVFIVAQIWVVGSFIYLVRPEAMHWTRIAIPRWSRWLGVAITIPGMVLEFYTQISLGRNYATTLHIGEDQALVTTGPYQHIRHPMYTALFTIGIGLGLLSSSWYFLLPFLATAVVVALRIQKEEEAMVGKFGDRYRQYILRTGRFIPRIRRK